MHYWRFLLLAFLAALHPISSFTDLNSLDGRGQWCDNEATSLSQETRLSYGSNRLWKTCVDDNRLNLKSSDIPKNRRHEIDFSFVRRSTEVSQVADRRSERDTRRDSHAHFRSTRDNMKRAETGEGDRRQREFNNNKERDTHRITSRDISRIERDRVRNSRAISIRANGERYRISMESRHELRNPSAHSEFQENRESRNFRRAGDDVVSVGRRDQQTRPSRSLERHDHKTRDRMETRHELSQNEFRLNTERVSTYRMSRSLEGRDHVEIREERNEQRLNRVRDSTNRMRQSLDRHDHRVKNRMETRDELGQNEFRLNRERDLIYRMSRSLERRNHRARNRMEVPELGRNELTWNRERDSTHRMSQSLERPNHRAKDISEARDEHRRSEFMTKLDYSQDHVNSVSQESINDGRMQDFGTRLRLVERSNQRMVRGKRFTELSSSKSRYQTRDLEQRQATEMFNERRILRSRQDTKVRLESRRDHRALNVNNRLATGGEMAVQRSRSESIQRNQRLLGQNDRRLYEKDVEDRRFRSQSLHRDINRERLPLDRRERERNLANRDRDEGRVSRVIALSSLDEERQQFVDRHQRERDSVDRVLMTRRESRLKIRNSLDGSLQQTRNRSPTERNSVSRARDEIKDVRINALGVRTSFDENRRETDPVGSVRHERSESRVNLREVQRLRDEGERRNFRRDISEQRDIKVSRTMRIRDIRQESRGKRSRESVERSRNIRLVSREVRRSIRYDDRESRAFDRSERTASRLMERSEGLQGSRDFNHNVKINTRTENRNLERENYRFRSDVRYAENRDSFVLRYKTKEAENIYKLNWQYLLYTLQAIYLCSIFAKVLTKDETGMKSRSLPWWTGPTHSLVKVD